SSTSSTRTTPRSTCTARRRTSPRIASAVRRKALPRVGPRWRSIARLPISTSPAATGRLSTFAALKARNYCLYWIGLVFYVLGHRAEYVTFAWIVWELTHDPLYLGYLGLAQGVPLVVFQVFGGVLADRVHRLRLLIGTQLLTAATLAGALGLGLAAAASFLALALYSRIRLEGETPPHDGQPVLTQLADGLRFVGADFVFASLIALAMFNSLFGMSYVTLLPIFADSYFKAGSVGYGLLNASHGARFF